MLANNLEIILSLQAAVYHNPVITDFKHPANEANPLHSEIKKQVICHNVCGNLEIPPKMLEELKFL